MEIKIYQIQAARTMANLETHLMDNLHMVLGMQTETAELSDIYKKNIAYKKDLDLVNAKEEIGDLMWYVANYCNLNGWDLRDIMQTNIKKLQSRYPDKFTTEKAISRDLEAERTILEK